MKNLKGASVFSYTDTPFQTICICGKDIPFYWKPHDWGLKSC